MEHVCSKVEIIFLRLMDYTEIRNKIVLCMTLQNRLDFPIFRRARFAQYIEPLFVGDMRQSYCTITKLFGIME